MEDQQIVKAFLPQTPQKAFADGVRAWRVIRRFENLNGTCCCHPSEARPKFAIIITNQILRCLPIRRGFSKLLSNPGMLGDRVTPTWITRLDLSSMMTNAKSGRKKRSVICKKSQAQICPAWLRRKVAHFCPLAVVHERV